jgi:four helix bundle protein
MSLRSYKELDVWQLGMDLVVDSYRISRPFPAEERFGLTAQVRRAAVSIPANVAEGYGRETRGEYRNQVSVACGSANELETLLLISIRLGFLQPNDAAPVLERFERVHQMLWRLRSSLSRR